jgi:hypothetical protein
VSTLSTWGGLSLQYSLASSNSSLSKYICHTSLKKIPQGWIIRSPSKFL